MKPVTSYNIDNIDWGMDLEGVITASLHNKTVDVARSDYAAILQQHLQQPIIRPNCYYHWSPDNWVVTNDHTIKPEGKNEIDIEIKTPILKPEHIDALPHYLKSIHRTKLKTNARCALHLHVSPLNSYLSGREPVWNWKAEEATNLYENFMANLDAMEACLGPRLVGSTLGGKPRTYRNPRIPSEELQAITRFDSLTDRRNHEWALDTLVHKMCPPRDLSCPNRDNQIMDRRKHQLNLVSMLPYKFATRDGYEEGKGTAEIRVMNAEDYVTAAPFMRMLMALVACSLRGEVFVLADYAKTVAHDKHFALPSRPASEYAAGKVIFAAQ